MAALLRSQMTIQQGPALMLTEMVCCSENTCMTMQKPLKCRLDQQKRNFLTHRKKTSTMMTITTAMKKNEKYGKMVGKCTCRFHLSFDMLQIVEVRNNCACNNDLARELMPTSVHRPRCSLHHRCQVHSPPCKTTSYIRQGLRWQKERLQNAMSIYTQGRSTARVWRTTMTWATASTKEETTAPEFVSANRMASDFKLVSEAYWARKETTPASLVPAVASLAGQRAWGPSLALPLPRLAGQGVLGRRPPVPLLRQPRQHSLGGKECRLGRWMSPSHLSPRHFNLSDMSIPSCALVVFPEYKHLQQNKNKGVIVMETQFMTILNCQIIFFMILLKSNWK
jgi:hypothetical protein